MSHTHTISVLVENEFGVLARVAGMFAARGFNIDSLSVGTTLDPRTSHITIVTHGNDVIIDQILKQLNRLIDVIHVQDLTSENFISRQTVLIKLKGEEKNKADVLEVVKAFRAELITRSGDSFIIDFTGENEKVEELIKRLEPYGILELVRTGTVAIQK